MVAERRIEVALEVGPAVAGVAVAERAVELDERALVAVAHVAAHEA